MTPQEFVERARGIESEVGKVIVGHREVVRGVLCGRPCPDAASFYRLRSAGLMRGESFQHVQPRCAIYATYLRRHLP